MGGAIPVKMVLTQDMHGNEKMSVMTDMRYALNAAESAALGIVRAAYVDAVEECRRILAAGPRRPSILWRASLVLARMHDSVRDDCTITNRVRALERDLKQDNVGAVLRMAHFEERHITDNATFTHYVELLRAQKKLETAGVWEREVEWLVREADAGTLPKTKEYRRRLSNMGRLQGSQTAKNGMRRLEPVRRTYQRVLD